MLFQTELEVQIGLHVLLLHRETLRSSTKKVRSPTTRNTINKHKSHTGSLSVDLIK